jgi:hypothetical protein
MGDEPEPVRKLTMDMTGDWIVETRDSSHHFHLDGDASTVTRIPGPHAIQTPFDEPCPLRSIEVCTVSIPGYWTLPGDDSGYFEHFWICTSLILSITQDRSFLSARRPDDPFEEGR